MKNLPLLVVTLTGVLALVLGIAVIFSRSNPNTGKMVDEAQVVGEARLVKGKPEAKITLVEFSDFQCPGCRAITPFVKEVTDKYPNEVRVIYRHFPLNTLHPNAQLAGQAAEAAFQANKFWEMHDLLFQNQDQWSTNTSAQAKERFAGYAEQIGIDKQQFLERIDSDSAKNAVNQDLSLATQLGLNSTPTIFINGQQFTAPATQLMTTVESLLNSK